LFYVKYYMANKKLVVSDAVIAELYATTEASKASYLEGKLGPNTIVFFLNCFMSWVGCYTKNSTVVTMSGLPAARCIAELKITALVLGQDNDESNYTENEGGGYDHDATNATRTMRVPGIAMSQLDQRNQKLLKDASVVLTGVSALGKAQHDPALTALGHHASTQGAFFATPLFLGGWP
jgi:hypothetical protein